MMYALEIEDLSVCIKTEAGIVEAVKGISFSALKGSVTGIVGESGAGKSMSMKAVLGILPPNAKMRCTDIRLEGQSIVKNQELRRQIAWIPQNPSSALDPVFMIGTQMTETVSAHKHLKKKEAKLRSLKFLSMAGLKEPEKCMRMYPFELSGGMCQRVVAAMAMAAEPHVIIADEPTASLDQETKNGILGLFKKWVDENKTSVVMISHDLDAVSAVCQEVCVMLEGQFIESGKREDVFHHPRHSYTRLLLESCREGEEF